MEYICRIPNKEELVRKWDYEISIHKNKEEWKAWKEEFITAIESGDRISYFGFLGDEIICEGSASLTPQGYQNPTGLIARDTAYLSAFRTVDKYQGQGYFSKLYKYIEQDLIQRGYTKLTIGVEPCEVKNMLIYFNWGFDKYIKTETETFPSGDKILINYYLKDCCHNPKTSS